MWSPERRGKVQVSQQEKHGAWCVRVLGLCGLMLVWVGGGCESSQVAGDRATGITATPRAAIAATSPAACQFPGPWTREAPDPVQGSAGGNLTPLNITADPSVIYDGNRFRMWFTSGDSKQRTGIAYAESSDGKRWTLWKKAGTAADSIADLVVTSTPSGWDTPGIENAAVLRLPAGGYRMYFTGNRPPEGSNAYAIGLATSDDGIAWRKHGPGPIFEAANPWERPTCTNPQALETCRDGGPLEPSVIYDSKEGLYKMWYAAVGVKGYLSFRIGYATSKDGISWTRRPEPVFEPGGKGAWDETWVSHVNVIPDPQAGYHLFYYSTPLADICEGCGMQPGMIGHAYSVDGIKWTRNPKNPILSPRKGRWDGWTVGGPTAIIREGKIWLWYHGFESKQGLKSAIGLATAPCGS